MSRRAPFRPEVPAGVQPERDGRLQCLECGAWYRNVGTHVRMKHGISPDDYRAAHELPAGRGLVPADLSEAMAARQRRRMETEPDLRAVLAEGARRLAGHGGRRARRRRDTEVRAGVQRAWRNSALVSSEIRSARTRAADDQLAQRHGHPSMLALLEATTQLSDRQLGAQLDLYAHQVRRLRTRYGVRSRSRQARAAQRDADQRRVLAAIPPATQPADPGRGMQCLECGRWSPKLSVHLTRAHHITPDQYLDRHQLDATQSPWLGRRPKPARAVPTAAQRAQRLQALRRSVANAAAARSRQIRAGYDERARQLGHADLDELLKATGQLRQRDVAALLGVSTSAVGRLRGAAFGPAARRPRPANTDRVDQHGKAQAGRTEEEKAARRRAGTVAAGKLAAARAAARWQERAEQLGYPNVEALIAGTIDLPVAQATELIGVRRSHLANLRARYGPRPAAVDGPGQARGPGRGGRRP